MTLTHAQSGTDQLPNQPAARPRLRLKPKAPRTGYIDGAWWPHSDDLASELPDLLAVMSVRLGPIDRVVYGLSEWTDAPAKFPNGGRTTRLDGYRYQPSHTVQLLGVNRSRIVLLVVPPDTDPDIAHHAMMTAAAPGNAATVDALLTIDGTDLAADDANAEPQLISASAR